MPRRKDIWRCGIIDRPVEQVLSQGLADQPVHWLAEEPRFHFLADPFSLAAGRPSSPFRRSR